MSANLINAPELCEVTMLHAAQSFLEDKGCAISPINTDPAEWGGSMIKMRVKPRPSGRGRKARSDIENVAAMAD